MSPPKRLQSATERDMAGLAARRERQLEREAAPVESFDDFTNRYEGPDLDAARDGRDPLDRIRRLEKKQDKLDETITETRLDVAALRGDVREMRGELSVLPKLVSLLEQKQTVAVQRELADVEVGKAAKLEPIDARKTKRDTIAKVVGGGVGTGVLYAVLRHLGVM